MKKSLLILCLLSMCLALASCGGNTDSSDASDGEPINGIWMDSDRLLVIENTAGYYDTGSGFVYGCDVNLKKKTIKIMGYGWDNNDPEYNYEFINDKLVLETDDKDALSDTLTFELSEQALIDSSDKKLDGDWYLRNKVLTIDGEKGLMETDFDPYKCEIDTSKNVITIKKYSWDDSDPAYNAIIINGKLLLCSDNEKALDKTMLFLTKEEYDSIPKDETSDTDDGEDEATNTDEDKVEDTSDSANSVFSPQDVSDKTIESIKTYGDYLAMYKAIIDDYWANYEKVIKGTVLYDEASFNEMKEGLDEAYDEQDKQYGSMKNKKLVGKSDLVEFLKEYRDSLKEYTDSLSGSLDVAQ